MQAVLLGRHGKDLLSCPFGEWIPLVRVWRDRFVGWQASDPAPLGFLLHTRARQRHETTDRLPEIRQPTLVVHGTEDTVKGGTSFHPESSRVLAERIPNARLEKIPGAAHHVFWQTPDLVNARILEFLLAN